MPDSLTAPKPFVFVLMPFDTAFADIYKFGIKGAAEDVGAYAERIDEQIFTEGMLDRIFNQISKADVIVADMTGRNPNVFYEVGYAHALSKVVLLLTQDSADIPFDLKHRQHTVYGGRIEMLRSELAPKIVWAIAESRRRAERPGGESFSILISGLETPRVTEGLKPPVVKGTVGRREFRIPIQVRNDSLFEILGITHVYLFCEEADTLVPTQSARSVRPSLHGIGGTPLVTPASSVGDEVLVPFRASAVDSQDGLKRLRTRELPW